MKIQIHLWLSMILFILSNFKSSVEVKLAFGQCLPEQKFLLIQLRNNLTFDSSLSTKLARWDERIDCCGWRGVHCGDAGHVIGLDLSNDSISGVMDDSSSLFRLQFLQRLSLAENSFEYSAQLPTGFGQLTQLNYLNLSETGFGGQIPSEFSRLSRLVTLDLSSSTNPYLLKLERPNLQMLVQNFTRLRELRLDGVDIAANGKDWCQAISTSLPDLQVLSLSYCNISGPLDSPLAKLQSLSVIRLDGNNFSGPLPDFFAEFTNLTVLSLSACNLLGETPRKIFQVSTLLSIDLSNNRELGGSLAEFPQDGSLENLELSFTTFAGNLPESIGNLSMLSGLQLSNCNFSGPIPSSLSNLSQLVSMDLSRNHFTGSLPSLGQSKKLTLIGLGGSDLIGTIPPQWEGLVNLVSLDLSDNSLGGDLPTFLFSLPSLKDLKLSNNQFSGQISELQTVPPSPLQSIDLSSNNLEGPFPEFFFRVRSLSSISLFSNKFTGTVDLIKFSELENLWSLDLSFNNLSVVTSGSDPAFSLLPQFNSLMLASCKLQKFPFLKNQSRLNMLDLSDNQITGEIPNWVWEINSGYIPFLNLSHNQFVRLEEPYRFHTHQYLDLHSNMLTGQIPLPPRSAVYVDFSSNKFASPMPLDIGNYLSSAIFFKIANSSIVGGIPPSICNASRLQVLDLSDNYLNSSIPSCLIEMSRTLDVLNLRRNELGGNLHRTFPNDCGLETLDLSSNLLQGLVPESLANCTKLKVLNLGNNKISDGFPCWLERVPNLQILVLHFNSLHGDISCPDANYSWPKLQIIDIASNNFNGVLPPKFFSSLTGMMVSDDERLLQLDHLNYQPGIYRVYYQDSVTMNYKGHPLEVTKILSAFTSIDLSSNNFQGPIPETLGDLRSLRLLNISNNGLTGQIPPSAGNLKELEALDLSFNKLSGEIPIHLASLTSLGFLNLSYNQFIGMIPRGSQIQTFPESSFEGNEDLCGFPLNRTCNNSRAPALPQPAFEEEKQLYSSTEIYLSVGIGLFVGFGIIFGPLWFSNRWRKCYNKHVDKLVSRILHQQENHKARHLNEDW